MYNIAHKISPKNKSHQVVIFVNAYILKESSSALGIQVTLSAEFAKLNINSSSHSNPVQSACGLLYCYSEDEPKLEEQHIIFVWTHCRFWIRYWIVQQVIWFLNLYHSSICNICSICFPSFPFGYLWAWPTWPTGPITLLCIFLCPNSFCPCSCLLIAPSHLMTRLHSLQLIPELLWFYSKTITPSYLPPSSSSTVALQALFSLFQFCQRVTDQKHLLYFSSHRCCKICWIFPEFSGLEFVVNNFSAIHIW